MMTRRWIECAVSACLMLAVVNGSIWAAGEHLPSIFQKMTFEEATSQAAKEDRLLIIDFMATWCPPCRRMDQMTWPDPKLTAWVASYALAIQIDVDKESKLAENFGIEAMPTVVVLKREKTLGRFTGFRDADETLTWFEQVRTGKEPPPAPTAKNPREEGHRRLKEAREALAAGNYDAATDQYLWLWEHILELSPSFVGVKYSYLVEDLKRLASKHEPARRKLTALRDAVIPKITDERIDREKFKDWFHLCQAIGEEEKILTWFDSAVKSPSSSTLLLPVQLDITDFLIEQKKLVEAGNLMSDPLTNVRAMMFMGKTGDLLEDASLARFVAGRWVALLAAGRKDEAAQVLKELFSSLGQSPEIRINVVEAGVDAGVRLPEFDEWLKEAEEQGKDVASLSATLKSLPPLKIP